MFISFYCFECFILEELYKLVVKAVWKLAYKQVLVPIGQEATLLKHSKGLFQFIFFFSGHYGSFIYNLLFSGKTIAGLKAFASSGVMRAYAMMITVSPT